MEHEDMTKQLRKLTDDLSAMFELVQEAYNMEQRNEKRYNMGVMVGIGYAHGELKKIVSHCGEHRTRQGKGK